MTTKAQALAQYQDLMTKIKTLVETELKGTDLKLDTSRLSYNVDEAAFKIEVKRVGEDGISDLARKDWDFACNYIADARDNGLLPEHLGMTFEEGGDAYTLIGWNRKAPKNPIQVVSVNNGSRYIFPKASIPRIVAALAKAPKAKEKKGGLTKTDAPTAIEVFANYLMDIKKAERGATAERNEMLLKLRKLDWANPTKKALAKLEEFACLTKDVNGNMDDKVEECAVAIKDAKLAKQFKSVWREWL